MSNTQRKKIGLALGSGGARGLMHIGIIKALLKHNIPIDYIAGTSAGALIGAMYSYKKDIESVEKFWKDVNKRQVFKILFDLKGITEIIRGRKAKKFINTYLNYAQFDDLQIPFNIVATSLKTGHAKVINEGEVAVAIKASSSIPLIFSPEKIDGELFIDGGMSNPVPADTVRFMGADIVIAVNLDSILLPFSIEGFQNKSIFSISQSSVNLFRYHLSKHSVASADIVIEPMTNNKKSLLITEFDKSDEFIEIGMKATEKIIENSNLLELIHSKV